MYRVKNIRKQFSWLCWLLCWLLCSHCPSICSIASNTTEDDSVAVFAPIDAVITQDNSHHTRFSSSLEWTNFRIYNKERVIIEMAGNAAQPGRLLGILGPSGSGKSTFLRAIASRSRKNLRKEGNIYYVKETGEKTKLGKHEVAFVHQDDSFFGMLTVQETLKLALELRCNSKAFNLNQRRLSKQEREHIIKDTLHLLGLNKISDSQVGGRSTTLDDQAHGISGGERKRLSVACEMMGNPRMLIADEPTSGLDSFQALQVMTTLHDIARTKQIITICTVHQPRSTIWNLFDDVMILSPLGKVVYFGPRENVLTYLESIGFPCPGNTNPAEYLIDLVSIDNTTPITIQQSISRIETLIHKFEEYQMKSNRKESTGSTSTSVASGRIGINVPETKPHSHLASVTAKPMRMIRTVLSSMKRSLSRFSLLFGRALKQTIRDSKTNIARVGISALLALVISSVYGEQGQQIDPKSISNRVNIIAQAAINVAMLSMIKTLQLFKKERAVIDRERSQDQYNSVEYLLAKTSAELPVDALVSAVFGWILHRKTKMHCEENMFVSALSLLGTVCSSLGLAIGGLAPSGDIALAIGPALMVVYVIMGAIGPAGVSLDKLPPLLRPFRDCSPIKWTCEALCSAEFRGQSFGIVKSTVADGTKRMWTFLNPLHLLKFIFRSRGSAERMSDGDHVLDALGIANSSYGAGSFTLWKMLGSHLLLALIGLIFTNSND